MYSDAINAAALEPYTNTGKNSNDKSVFVFWISFGFLKLKDLKDLAT